MSLSNLRVAVVHDCLPVIGGAEKVLQKIIELVPNADIYTLINFLPSKEQKELFGSCKIFTSYLNSLPYVNKYYRNLLPLYPGAIESFDLEKYDLIISSSYSVAKGVITHADQLHISYVHSPARYAWDLTHQYLRQTGLNKGLKGHLARYLLGKFRVWDYRTSNGVDCFSANSNFIAKRIWKTYRRTAEVIYPPVDLNKFTYRSEKEEFYLTASRLVPYKRIDAIAEAFTKTPNKKLVIIGKGPEETKINNIVSGHDNIEVLGYQSDEVLIDYMGRAKAFIFAAEEDFGIIPLEAQACGTPVIAFGAGGALETVVNHDSNRKKSTGIFFEEQTPDSILNAVIKFENIACNISSLNCREHSLKFSPEEFKSKFSNLLTKEIKNKWGSEAIYSSTKRESDLAKIEPIKLQGKHALVKNY